MAPPPTNKDCHGWEDHDLSSLLEKEELLEEVVWNGFKTWHLILFSISAVLSLIILLCCCLKFRIPRTKQEIEADYIRRRILRKFRKRLKGIQNQELDEMDLKKALDKIRSEFKSDTESLAQSEGGFSSLSSTGAPPHGSTYRRASQIQIDISLEELKAHSLGFGARVGLALAKLFGGKGRAGDKVALTVELDADNRITLPPQHTKGEEPVGSRPGPSTTSKQAQRKPTQGQNDPKDHPPIGENKDKKEGQKKELTKLKVENEVAKKGKDNPKDKPAEKPKDKPKDKPIEKPKDKPKDKPVEKPKDKPKDKPAEKPKDKPKDKPVEKPKDKPKDKPVEKPKDKPKDKPTDKPKDKVKDDVKKEKELEKARVKKEKADKKKEVKGTPPPPKN